jgi:hypothetical protein
LLKDPTAQTWFGTTMQNCCGSIAFVSLGGGKKFWLMNDLYKFQYFNM